MYLKQSNQLSLCHNHISWILRCYIHVRKDRDIVCEYSTLSLFVTFLQIILTPVPGPNGPPQNAGTDSALLLGILWMLLAVVLFFMRPASLRTNPDAKPANSNQVRDSCLVSWITFLCVHDFWLCASICHVHSCVFYQHYLLMLLGCCLNIAYGLTWIINRCRM